MVTKKGTVVNGTAKLERLIVNIKGCQLLVDQFDLDAEEGLDDPE